FQRLESRLEVLIPSCPPAFERMKPREAGFVHERLNLADAGQRVETSFHRLAGNEPGAETDHEGLDRRFDGEVEQKEAPRHDEWHGDKKDLDLRREPVDQRQ